MYGLAFFLGVGFTLLGAVYTAVVLYMPGAVFLGQRAPYLRQGVALLILAVSLFGRDLHFLPRPAVYVLWAVAAALVVWANREIVAVGAQKKRRPVRRLPDPRNN